MEVEDYDDDNNMDNNNNNNNEEDDAVYNYNIQDQINTDNGNPNKAAQQSLNQKQHGNSKQKRRSKNDCTGRDYVCGCGKTYLSYPAWYTHIKTKHNGKTPEGTNANQIQSGHGRGRPRKNFLWNEETIARRNREKNRRENAWDERGNELKDWLNRNNSSPDSYKENELSYYEIYSSFGLLKEIKEKEIKKIRFGNADSDDNDSKFEKDDYWSDENSSRIVNQPKNRTSQAQGNNNSSDYNPLSGFPANTCNRSYIILYKQVEQWMNTNKNESKVNHINSNKMLTKAQASINESEVITCDQAFARFIYKLSKEVTFEFYKTMIILLRTYRDCMNKVGWQILSQFKDLNGEKTNLDYCSVKDPSRWPEISNDFLNKYLPLTLPNFDKYFAVIITSHFNYWWYGNNYTIINLKMTRDIVLPTKSEAEELEIDEDESYGNNIGDDSDNDNEIVIGNKNKNEENESNNEENISEGII